MDVFIGKSEIYAGIQVGPLLPQVIALYYVYYLTTSITLYYLKLLPQVIAFPGV